VTGGDDEDRAVPEQRLILNVHVEAIDYAAALEAAKPVLDRVQGFARIRECRVRPYPKFDSQFSVWLDMDADDPTAAFDRLATDLATQWDQGGDGIDRFRIWDYRRHVGAALPGLRWMHLNLFVPT